MPSLTQVAYIHFTQSNLRNVFIMSQRYTREVDEGVFNSVEVTYNHRGLE